jgi:hypothetical protein
MSRWSGSLRRRARFGNMPQSFALSRVSEVHAILQQESKMKSLVKCPLLVAAVFAFGGVCVLSAEDAQKPEVESHIKELSVQYEPPKPPEPRPFVGISMEAAKPEDVKKAGGPDNCAGVKVSNVVPGEAAEKAGIKAGDIIIGGDKNGAKTLFTPAGENFTPQQAFVDLLTDRKPGDVLNLYVLREGKEIAVAVTLGVRKFYVLPAAEHPELAFPQHEPSRLEKFLRDNQLYDKYVETAHWLYDASNSLYGQVEAVPDKPDFFRLKQVNYLLRHPENTALVSDEIADSIENCFNDKACDAPGMITAAAKWIDEEPQGDGNVRIELKGDKDDVDRIVEFTKKVMELRNESLKNLSADEVKSLYAHILQVYSGEADPKAQLATFQIMAKVDYPKLFGACRAYAQLTAPDNLALLKKMAESCKGAKPEGEGPGFEGDILLVKKTEIGTIVIGGEGKSIYNETAAIIIDLGGDDYYANAVAVSSPDYPFSLCVDFAGNDVYSCRSSAGQATGLLGAGILVDMAGNDTYSSGFFAQGCGIGGVGVLMDLAGDDMYYGEQMSQGIGMFGVGILADRAGNDKYTGFEFVQGVGLVKGFGALLDASGNDFYTSGGRTPDNRMADKSCVSLSQGMGVGTRPEEVGGLSVPGGIGLLADAEGNDNYVADYFGQGAGFWFGFGILRDKPTPPEKKPENTEKLDANHFFAGRYCQGAGVHMAFGALIVGGGEDTYVAYFGVGQGCGHDTAYGILEDRGTGNDFYESNWLAMGAGNDTGIGVLFDHGGNDRYCTNDQSLGQGNIPAGGKYGSVGIFMHLGGTAKYMDVNDEPGHSKQIARKDRHIGLFFDAEK